MIQIACPILIGDKGNDIQADNSSGVGANARSVTRGQEKIRRLNYDRFGLFFEVIPYVRSIGVLRGMQ